MTFTELGGTVRGQEFEQGEARVGPVDARAFPQSHPGGSLGFRFGHGGRTVVYSTDNELDRALLNARRLPTTRPPPRRFPKRGDCSAGPTCSSPTPSTRS